VPRNLDWYDLNATRAYPLDDAATARDDAGREVPSQVLVDCRLRFPSTLGRCAYLGALTVGPGVVTAAFMVASGPARPAVGDAPAAVFAPLAVVSVRQPVTPYRHYPVLGLAPGVGGWVVFGKGCDEPYSGRLSSPTQGMLLPRTATAYRPLPVLSLGKLGLSESLSGLIRLVGGTDIQVLREVREVEGVPVEAMVIRLIDDLNRNVLSLYAGSCGGRPESHTCPETPLEKINIVEPDCAGNLILDFRGVRVLPRVGDGGLVLDLARGLAETCFGADHLPDDRGLLPGEYFDLCSEVSESPSTQPPQESSESYQLPSDSSESLPCLGLPFYQNFDDCDTTGFVVEIGQFGCEDDDSPDEPYGLFVPGYIAVPRCYSALDPSRRNVSIWDDCGYDNSLGLRCLTHVRPMPGTWSNGGIVINYHLAGVSLRPQYYLALVNPTTNALELHFYNGSMISRVQFARPGSAYLTSDHWYALTIETRPGSTPILTVILQGVTDPDLPETTLTLPAAQYGTPDGKFGLGSINAHARFSFFQLEAL
jgi:hypothetical protein